jgi:hypothetical protein
MYMPFFCIFYFMKSSKTYMTFLLMVLTVIYSPLWRDLRFSYYSKELWQRMDLQWVIIRCINIY